MKWMFIAACSVLMFASSIAGAAAVLHVTAPSTTPSVGNIVTIDVGVSNAVDLYAYQFDFTFDPGVLSFVAVTEGTFFSDAGPTFFVEGTQNGGAVEFTSATLISSIAGASGFGGLTQFQFATTSEGVSIVALTNVLLLNSQLESIEFELQNDSVTVGNEATPVPIPGAALLLLSGLAGMGAALKKRTIPKLGAQ